MTVDPWLAVLLFGLLIIACLFLEEDMKAADNPPSTRLFGAILRALSVVVFVASFWVIASLALTN